MELLLITKTVLAARLPNSLFIFQNGSNFATILKSPNRLKGHDKD